MSIEAMKWALDEGEARNLEPAQRYILLILGTLANDTGGNLYPSHAYLSRRTGIAVSTVRAHINSMARAGILGKVETARQDGGQSSNHYQLAMIQPGLGLEENTPPPARIQQGGAPESSTPPARIDPPPPYTGLERKKVGKGVPTPSPTALTFQAYQAGIQRMYGAEYPRSAKVMGQFASLVGRVGAQGAQRVTAYYLASQKPFYRQRKHAVDILLKDAENLYLEMQQHAGGAAAGSERVPSEARVVLLDGEGTVKRRLDPQPIGRPEDIAKTTLASYARMIHALGTRYIGVGIGAQMHRFSVEELQKGRH